MDNSDSLLEKEIRECEKQTNFVSVTHTEYYRGLHDAYIHLLRFIESIKQSGEKVRHD